MDTGASTTLVSTALYHRIPEKECPEIGPAHNVTAADGSPLEVLGRAKFDLELGTLRLRREFTIAGITDDLLLGADVLQNHPDGPADLLLSEQRMVLHGESIPLLMIGAPHRVRKAWACHCFVIPPLSEMIVDVYVDRSSDDTGDTTVIIEPDPDVQERMGLGIARCLVNVADNTTVGIRVMNPCLATKTIRQDTVLGYAEQAGLCSTAFSTEDTSEQGDHSQAQHTWMCPFSTANPAQEAETRKTTEAEGDAQHIPSHLQQHYLETVAGKDTLLKRGPCSGCSKRSKEKSSSLGNTEATVHTTNQEPLLPPADVNESHLRKSWQTFCVFLVLLSGWIMCTDSSPSLTTTADTETSQAGQSSPRPPSSLLTEGETRDDGRLWPKLGKWGAASIQRIIRSTRVALGRECKKVTMQGAARRKTRCEPALRPGGLHDQLPVTLNTSRGGTVPQATTPNQAGPVAI